MAMRSPDEVDNQQQLLAIYRRNLQHLLRQAAEYGGEDSAPLEVMNNIADVRGSIQELKQALRAAGVAVEDRPGEQPPADDAPLVMAPARGGRRRWPLAASLAIGLLCLLALGLLFRNPFAGAPGPLAPAETGAAAAVPPAGSPAPAAAPATSAGALPQPTFPTPAPTLPPVAALNISNTPGRSEGARIAVDAAGVVHVVWLDITPRQGKSATLLHRAMTPDGTWSAIEDLTPQVEYVGSPFFVANANRDLCLVLHSVAGIYTRCLANGTWTPLAQPVSGGTRNIFAPALSADGQVRWVLGLNDLQFGDMRLDDGLTAVVSAGFAIDARGGYHAVWQRGVDASSSIEHRVSTDGGATWSQQERLTTPDARFATSPALVADAEGAVHLVWAETGVLRYRRWSQAEGWSPPVAFAAVADGSQLAVAVDQRGRPAAVWSGSCGVHHAAVGSDGAWSPPRQIAATDVERCPNEPQIAIDTRGQHIVWLGKGADGQADVFYARLPAGP
jgi:hypothetical protein